MGDGTRHDVSKCLPPSAVKRILLAALQGGEVAFTGHAVTEMRNDRIAEDEALAVLRGGGSWRYRVRLPRVFVVVALRSQSAAVVVTAWRTRR
jgi:hypothetical protein